MSLEGSSVNPVRRAFLSLAMVVAVCARGTVAQEDSQEYEAKARFLAIAPEFVEWPPSTFKTPAAPLEICVYGSFLFGTSLAEVTRNATVHGHRVEAQRIRKEQGLPGKSAGNRQRHTF